ncbi:Voltage-gated potassium channel subunit beta-2 [Phytophthora pseudosyringae]|uniref:Voltage-gated potassium channel subunit beta-2 n=1 Tax=Phytophthora pseudosyringae TaxID=221518 RepID=A0A8T1VDA2_9STRA|nr:Voltage-gated potassium channel subunit beta-2 [Phytophthora pseudosyringae]
MNFVVEHGWAFYWGTSECLPWEILEACEIADRLGLTRPVVEQSQYNIFERTNVDFEYVDLYKKYKLGLSTPLSEGFEEHVAMADKLRPIAEEAG